MLKTRKVSRFLLPYDYIFFGFNTLFDYENLTVTEEVVLSEYFKKMKN